MAGRELDETGRSPAEIRRLKARRKRMLAAADARKVDKPDAATRRGGFNTRRNDPATAALAARVDKAKAAVKAKAKDKDKDKDKDAGKGSAKVKKRSSLVSSVEDRGRRNNKRIQRLAEDKTTTNTPPRPALLPGLLPGIRPMFRDTGAGTTADTPVASNSGTSASKAVTTSQSSKRRGSGNRNTASNSGTSASKAVTTSRSSKRRGSGSRTTAPDSGTTASAAARALLARGKKAVGNLTTQPQRVATTTGRDMSGMQVTPERIAAAKALLAKAGRVRNNLISSPRRVGLKKGGVVKAPKKAPKKTPKKSIDGIASKGKTRAKHR